MPPARRLAGVGPRPYGVGRSLQGWPAGLVGRTLLAGVWLAGEMGSG
jgi:hypothetical protein